MTVSIKDSSGTPVAIEAPLPAGRAAAASSKPTALSTEDLAVLNAIKTAVEALSAATATMNVAQDVSNLYNGATALPIKRLPINKTTSGDLLAAVSAKKIVVIDIDFMCSAALTVKFTSGTGPTDITGPMSFAANGGFAPGFNPTGLFATASGEKLSIVITGTGTVGGWLNYVEV